MNILYKEQVLNLHRKIDTNDQSFHNEDSLWITSPDQRNLPYMKFVGGFPNEWCIDLKDIAAEYSIETYKNRTVALIIKENDMFMAYMENPTSFNIGGTSLEEARNNFWTMLRYEDRYGVLVFEKYNSVIEIKCPSCEYIWWHDEKNISNGEMYEYTCPKCGMILKRKKV